MQGRLSRILWEARIMLLLRYSNGTTGQRLIFVVLGLFFTSFFLVFLPFGQVIILVFENLVSVRFFFATIAPTQLFLFLHIVLWFCQRMRMAYLMPSCAVTLISLLILGLQYLMVPRIWLRRCCGRTPKSAWLLLKFWVSQLLFHYLSMFSCRITFHNMAFWFLENKLLCS